MLTRFSSLSKCLRVTAWCLRWLPEGRRKGLPSDNGCALRCSTLTANKLAAAETRWIRTIQASHYKRELKLISENKSISGKSALTGFSPILDSEEVLRVGGRLE
jgi:hypothetical protein